ncbi:MAG: hypothetical protein ACYC2Y_07795 [Armatimonadota bacterium]
MEKRRRIIFAAYTLLLLAIIVVPRILAETVGIVKYDPYLKDSGWGYLSTSAAHYTRVASFALALLAIPLAFGDRKRWYAWAAVTTVAFLSFGLVRIVGEGDYLQATRHGQSLADNIVNFRDMNDRLPNSLEELPYVPETGLKRGDRFYLIIRGRPLEDYPRPWRIPVLLGREEYAIAAPLMPNGTILYRPSGNYKDLKSIGRSIGEGWFILNVKKQ